jgi:hypothetical protein
MSEKGMSAGKIVVITCGSLFGLIVVLPLLTFFLTTLGFGLEQPILALLIAGLVIFLVRRNNKLRGRGLVDPPVVAAQVTARQTISQSTQMGGDIPTTVCQHSFSATDLAGKATVTCPCGYKFKTKDLLDYQTLSASYLRIERDLMAVRQRLIASSTGSTPVAASQQSAPAAPVVRKVRKARASLSLQQWLIMGASAIIVVAGSIFVSTNLDTFPEEGFLGVTLGVGIGTALLAFWGRKFSVMLANFMATFSSAMLMFSILVAGDILNESFTWETAPAWFWTLNLLVVSLVSFVLARFKANFGWKIISIAALAASALVYTFGDLVERFGIGSGSFAWFSATTTLGGVLIGVLSTQVAKIKFQIDKGTEDHEYEKDLAKREDDALEKFSLFSVAAFALLSVGYLVLNVLSFGERPEPVPFTVFALVSVLAIATRSYWVGALSSHEAAVARINTWLRIYTYPVVAVALNTWFLFIDPNNYWLGVLGTTLIMFATLAIGFYVKRVGEYPLAVQVAHIATAATWILWYIGVEKEIFEYLAAFGVFLVAFGLSFIYQSFLGAGRSSTVAATVFHFLGLGALFLSVTGGSGVIFSTLESRVVFSSNTLEYALVALGLILLAVSYSPLVALVNKKLGKAINSGTQLTIFILTTVLTTLLAMHVDSFTSSTNQVYLVSVLAGSALVTGLLGSRSKTLGALLLRYSYTFQGVLALKLLVSMTNNEDVLFTGVALLLIAVLNYAISWIGKVKSSVWVGYGYSLGGLLLAAIAQRDELLIAAHLALVIVAALALNFVLRIVDKRVSGRYTTYFSLFSVFGLTLASILINLSKWNQDGDAVQIWLGLGILGLVAVVAGATAELKRISSERVQMALRVAGLSYMFIAFITLANFYMGEEAIEAYGVENLDGARRIAVAAIFAFIAFRQLQVSSAAKSNTTNGWFALSYLAPVTIALISSDLIRNSVDLDKFNLEIYTVPLALAFALPTIFNRAAAQSFRRLVGMDVPLLFPVAASAIYSLTQNVNEEATVYRLVASTAILAAYSFFRFSGGSSKLWAILEYIGLLGLGLSLAQMVEVLAPDLLEGPELFGLGAAGAILVGNKNLKKVFNFKSTLFSHGLPLFALVLPSIIHTYTTLDTSIQLTNPTQITRILAVLAIALVALILGMRNGNLGIAVAGGASLSLLILPITWANAEQSADYETTVALRALGVSLFLFLLLGGLRSINKLPDSSYLYLGIPSVVALAPSLFLTFTSIGNTSLTEVDWWRFGILMGATVTLLVVGALRSLGGLFFPGLVGVIVGVLPYAFQPIARESWFLWVVLLLIAAVMVWIAIRLEQLRKLGKTGASWIKTLR